MRYILLALIFLNSVLANAQVKSSFTIVPLGVKGGIDESNLSAYMLAPKNSKDYICLDAGTLHAGIEKAIQNKIFRDSADVVLKTYIKAYLISHPHLDHVSGLIINSPADTTKSIYGTQFCLSRLQNSLFTWQVWANFGDKGEQPKLNKYHYKDLVVGVTTPIEHTTMSVQAFVLSHSSPFQSTAFLIKNNDDYVLYLGDTGADSIEHSNNLHQLWQQVAPLIKSKMLKGIFIEVSYTNEQPLNKLFGHLTPSLLMEEMNELALLAGVDAMKNFPIIITHIKPEGGGEKKVHAELLHDNPLQLKLIFAEQGKQISL